MSQALLKLFALVLHIDYLGAALLVHIGQFGVQVAMILKKGLGVFRLQRHLIVQIVLRVRQAQHEVLKGGVA